ncbi:hypothetical protein O6P43_023755 [Quillaja saponaria]|uniref:Uncharacterized protein n=1 Tax=Quillaja saponaria TaxID=32244 RepID=A0AAD7PJV9_QUISA|nr:hypothetical protein O6P43_023755 [Quillaja saponaria]
MVLLEFDIPNSALCFLYRHVSYLQKLDIYGHLLLASLPMVGKGSAKQRGACRLLVTSYPPEKNFNFHPVNKGTEEGRSYYDLIIFLQQLELEILTCKSLACFIYCLFF